MFSIFKPHYTQLSDKDSERLTKALDTPFKTLAQSDPRELAKIIVLLRNELAQVKRVAKHAEGRHMDTVVNLSREVNRLRLD